MSDDLEQQIEQVRKSVAEAKANAAHWTHESELRQVRLQALEEAAALRPARGRKSSSGGSGRTGRKPGAISRQWRSILTVMTLKHGGTGALESEIVEIARTAGMENIRPKDVHERMESYREHGYVTLNQLTNRWALTETGAQRFNVDATEDSEAQSDKENAGADVEPTPAS